MPKFNCIHCGQRIEVRDVYAGRSFPCPSCNGQNLVPETLDPSSLNHADHQPFSWLDFYFSFNGRIGVADYWVKGILPGFVLGVLAMVVDVALGAKGVLYGLLLLISVCSGAALLVKRWHDRDKSGWYYWVILIPLAGPIWTLIEAGCLQGTKGPNRYGPDPLRRNKTPRSNPSSNIAPAPQSAMPTRAVRMCLRGRDLTGRSYEIPFSESDFQRHGGTLVIGRSYDSSQLILSHDSVSRQHATLSLVNGQVHAGDRNSSNGTKLNGRILSAGSPPAPLHHVDKLSLGEVDLMFEVIS